MFSELEATHLGLGCVWLGIAPIKERMEKVNDILSLEDQLCSFAIMAIGYLNEEIKEKDYYDESRIHYR